MIGSTAATRGIDQRPAPLVPHQSVTERLDDVRLAEPVYAGRSSVRSAWRRKACRRLAARLPAGTRAMAIPVVPGTAPALVLGDRVDVLVALAPEAAGDGPPGFALATDVLVVDVSDAAVTVAVPADTAPRIAVALGAGAVTLALTDHRTA